METKNCSHCCQEKPISEFTLRKGRKTEQRHSWCKDCVSSLIVKKRQTFKKECVDYKGGKCLICGYSKCIDSLHFHHIDPTEKDFSIANAKRDNSCVTLEEVKNELDKCALLCSNCHGEVHNGMSKLP